MEFWVVSDQTLKRGKDYYRRRRVMELVELTRVNGDRHFAAEVGGSRGMYYDTDLTVDKDGGLLDMDCDCPAFLEYPGPCKHLVAVALAVRDWTEGAVDLLNPMQSGAAGGGISPASSARGGAGPSAQSGRMVKPKADAKRMNPVRGSDAAVNQCIQGYEQVEVKRISKEQAAAVQEGRVHAVPKLYLGGSQLSLEITVGEKRQYVVKNLREFCQKIQDKVQLVFGKGLSFTGDLDSFHSDSKELVRFLMEKYNQIYSLDRASGSFAYSKALDQLYDSDKRSMRLTPLWLDELLALYENRPIEVIKRPVQTYSYRYYGYGKPAAAAPFAEGFHKEFLVRDGNPEITVTLKEEAEGVTFSVDPMPACFRGENHGYLCFPHQGKELWRCGEGYKEDMDGFLSMMVQNEGGTFVSRQDMVRFCTNVLAHVRDYAQLAGDTSCLEDYTPWDMEPQVYLDSPGRNVITAVVKGDYDGVLVNLYNDKEEWPPSRQPGDGEEDRLIRNPIREFRIKSLMERHFHKIDVDKGALILKGEDELLYDFIHGGQQLLGNQARIFATDRYKRLIVPAKAKLSAGVSLDGELLNVTFDLEGFPTEELLDALSAYQLRKKYHRLKTGAFVSLEDEDLQDAFAFAEGMHLSKKDLAAGSLALPKYRAMYLDDVMKRSCRGRFNRDGGFKALIREIREIEDSELEAPGRLEPVLRDYQKTGYCWLRTMARLGFGAILADDMGLGKTLQLIALLVAAAGERLDAEQEREAAIGAGGKPEAAAGGEAETAWEKAAGGEQEREAAIGAGGKPEAAAGGRGSVLGLVACPASLVLNWEKELEKFGQELSPYPILGTAAERQKRILALKEMGQREKAVCVVLTSYDLLKRDLSLYDGMAFDYHIVDEAQYIKNHSTQNARAVKRIYSRHRFALTGTPVENRLSELWSIFDFLMPDYFGSYNKFKENYEAPILQEKDERAAEALRRQVSPFVLRRLKQKVLSELPDKVESVVCVPMEGEQKKLYLANLAQARQEVGKRISEGGFQTGKLQILALLTKLRQLCCHPALCYEDYTKGSGKLEACMELIREAVEGGHRVLLFSQFTSMLALIEESLKKEKLPYYILTGKTDKATRHRLVNEFNENQIPVFLISLKAGGTGLNLTGADVVIHFDPWWNRAVQDQATDRAYRIGQEKNVMVYKLVAEATIEEKIVNLQEMKGDLADSIISENSTLLTMLSEKELSQLFE